MRHGTKYRYDQGCRCTACREAKMRARREARARARALNSPAYQRELEHARQLKESYRGTCEVCGASTTGCFGPGFAPTLCVTCSARKTGRARRGTGTLNSRVLAMLAERDMRMIEVAAAAGITQVHASVTLNRLLGYGLVERPRRGVYRRADA